MAQTKLRKEQTTGLVEEAAYDGKHYMRRFNTWVEDARITQHIAGLKMTWVSATALTVTTGTAYIPSLLSILDVTSDIAKTSLSLSNSTWYHVYLYSNSGTPDIELSTTAPAIYKGTARQKTADTSRRYVGSVKTDGSGNLYSFLHNTNNNVILYSGDCDLDASPFRALNGGVATVATEVDLSAIIPVTSRMGILRLNNTSDKNLFWGPTSNITGPSLPVGSTVTTTFVETFPLTATPGYYYKFNATPGSGGAYLDVYGYVFER